LNCNNPETTEAKYLEVISRKTAILFSAATRLAAVVSKSNFEVEEKLSLYGQHLGVAFQLIDDALDYKATKEELGKNLGDDLAEGKPTLPLIYAIKNSAPADANVIIDAIKNGNREAFNQVYTIIKNSKAIEYTEQRANEEAQKAIAALEILPNNEFKDALLALANFSVKRSF
jgi:octaprenyl-diphosphate synthase